MKSLPLLLVSLLAISAGCDTSEETPGDRSPPTSDGGPAAFDGGPSSDAMRDRDGQPASDGTTAPPAADAGQTDGAPGPVHPHAFELRSGESSVHLRARDVREPDFQNLDQAQYSARITFLDDAGETLRTVEAQLGGQTANGPGWEKLLWWPTRDVPVSAEIELRRSVPGGGLDETELVRTLTETIVPMPVVADQCMTNGFDNRCATGAACLEPADGVGRCHPIEAMVWQQTDGVTLDVRAQLAPTTANVAAHIVVDDEARQIILRPTESDVQWRTVGAAPQAVVPFSLYVGRHLYTHDVMVRTPPERAIDAPCDVRRVADRCQAGSACDQNAVCAPISAPILETISPVFAYDGQVLALRFTGRDADADVRFINIDLRPANDGAPESFRDRFPNVHARPVIDHFNQIEYDEDGSFSGHWFLRRDEDLPARSRMAVSLSDSEDLESERLEATVLPGVADEEVAAGGACDLAGVFTWCADGSFCALRDREANAVCHTPEAACRGPWPIRALDGPQVMANLSGAPDETVGYCTRQRGDFGVEHLYEFVPDSDGTYRFGLTGQAATLFLRRYCDLRGHLASEFACVGTSQPGSNLDAERVTIDSDLVADVPVYVFVESAWFGGGQYTLTVESL